MRQKRIRPAVNGAEQSKGSADYGQHTRHRADNRAVQLAAQVLREHGYMLAARCTACNRPLTAPASMARHIGPKCATRAGERR